MGVGSTPKGYPQQDYVFFSKLRKVPADLAALRAELVALKAQVAKLALGGTTTPATAGKDGDDGLDGAPGSALLHIAMLIGGGMYTLSATDTIGAVASAAAVVNYAFDGIPLDATGVPAALATLPGGVLSNVAAIIWPALAPGGAVVRLTLSNTDAANTVNVTLFRNGTTDQLVAFQIPAGGSVIWDGDIRPKTSVGTPA